MLDSGSLCQRQKIAATEATATKRRSVDCHFQIDRPCEGRSRLGTAASYCRVLTNARLEPGSCSAAKFRQEGCAAHQLIGAERR